MRISAAITACCVWLLFLGSSVRAETAIAEGTEWVLATSDRVVAGKVVQVDSVINRDKEECSAVTIAITKTFKGTPADRDTFLLPPYLSTGYAKQWMDDGIPMVFCLMKNDGKIVSIPEDKYAWVCRNDGNDPDAILLGESKHRWTGCVSVLTCDFQVLTDPKEILKFVEHTANAAAKDRPPRPHMLEVPFDTPVNKKLYSTSAVFLIVPIDEKLEALGQEWCKSDSTNERQEGARILRHFKNEKNIGILKSLLGDPGFSHSNTQKYYVVRREAFDALCDFDVKVIRPILEEPLKEGDLHRTPTTQPAP